MTAFEMYFIATVCPVMVCFATVNRRKGSERETDGRIGLAISLFTFPNVPSAISLITVYSPSFDTGWITNVLSLILPLTSWASLSAVTVRRSRGGKEKLKAVT